MKLTLLQRLSRLAEESPLIGKARGFAARMHLRQYRFSGLPYETHPLQVGSRLIYTGDEELIAAALVHDVLEDCDVSYKQLAGELGRNVAFLVESVSKMPKEWFSSSEERLREFHNRFLKVVDEVDERPGLLKIADRIENLKDLYLFKREKQVRIATETLEVYCPLALRLGSPFIDELRAISISYLEEGNNWAVRISCK